MPPARGAAGGNVLAGDGAEGPGRFERRVGEHRYGLVLLLTLLVTVLAVASPSGDVARVALVLVGGMTLLVMVVTSGTPRAVRHVIVAAVTVALVGAVPFVATGAIPKATALVIAALLAIAGLPALATGVLKLLRDEGVTVRAVFGALAVYLLIGLTFGFAIGIAADLSSTPYFGVQGEGDASEHIYFSFATLTTTGFGDLAPATNLGRGVAVLEELAGQIYLVTVIALMVGNLGRRPGARGRGAGPAA